MGTPLKEKYMKATVLVDNIAACGLDSEWGLAIYIEYKDKKILLDTGASGLFAENAEKLGIDIAKVDFGVLSHAHFDHADGMETFFELNQTAPFYLSSDAEENCYRVERDERGIFEMKYDGIKQGTLRKYADRIRKDKSLKFEITDGVYLLGHKTSGLDEVGERVGQYIVENFDMIPDDFAHEQSLIFETDKGLVVFNSCSHAGVDVIIKEAQDAFPGQSVHAMIGGFHMFMDSEDEVCAHAKRIKSAGAKRIITGHCTGEEQYKWLKDELEKESEIILEQLKCGLKIEI